jgi:threonine/homoserine/homoserine lactone efflux protein
MIGPVFFVLLETSIRKGFRAALVFDIGVLASDALYILLAYLFYAEVDKMSSGTNKALFGFIGGGIFIIYGIVNFFKKNKLRTETSIENIDSPKIDFVRTFFKRVSFKLCQSIGPFLLVQCTYISQPIRF